MTGVDLADADEGFEDARAYAAEHGIDNVEFHEGSIYELGFPDATFDVCTLLSMIETLDDPLAGLAEVRRVVRPGGLVGASSIEYGGLILPGPDETAVPPVLRAAAGVYGRRKATSIPTAGANSAGCCMRPGSTQVEARTTYFSYGTEERVRTFGLGRAADCRDEWYMDGLTKQGFASQSEIDALEQAWIHWAESPDSFAAFAWGRAIGRLP